MTSFPYKFAKDGYYTILWRWNAIRIIICLILEGFNIISDWPFGKLLFLWKLRYLYDLVHACGCLTQKKKKKSVKSNNRLPKERKQKKAWYWSKRLAQPKIYQPTYCPTNCQGLLNSLNTQSIYHGMEQRQHLHFCDGKNQTLYAMEVPPPRSTIAQEHTDEFLFVTSNCHIEISQYCPCWVKIDGI